MSQISNWLIIIGLFFALAAGQFLLRSHLDRKMAPIFERMDASKYVVIEAMPEQSEMLTSDFESEGWKLVETKTSSKAVLYTFRKLDALSTPLSMVLGHRGEKQSNRERQSSKFPMKIKDYGPMSESDA